MSNDMVRELLQKLATDDDYRKVFESDPAAELKAHGVEFDANRLPTKVSLPSKDDLARNADALASDVTSSMGIIFFKV